MTNVVTKYQRLGLNYGITEEQKEEKNNVIAKGKYLDTLSLINRELKNNSNADIQPEICITTAELEKQFGINTESAKIILQTLFVYGIISSTSRGEVVITKEELNKMIEEFKDHITINIQSEQTR